MSSQNECVPVHTNIHAYASRNTQKGVVMQLRHARGCHIVFWKPVQPLQRVPRLACSVASLSWYPGHQLLECYSLHCKTLTGYLLGKELPSAYTVTHSMQHCIPAPKVTAEPNYEGTLCQMAPTHTSYFRNPGNVPFSMFHRCDAYLSVYF